jgi:undecaprenyl-diphosphatase
LLVPRSLNIKLWPPLLFNLGISCVATFIGAMLFKDYAEDWGRRPLNIAVNLILFALLFWWSDRRQQRLSNGGGADRDPGGMGVGAPQFDRAVLWQAALLMGLAQFIAIFPGVSRSGITLTMGLFLGLSRQRAVNYSFLMGLPVILGGFVFKLRDIQGAVDWTPVLIGTLTSLIVGILAIVLFLRLLQRFGAMPFLIYRLLIGAVLIYFSL